MIPSKYCYCSIHDEETIAHLFSNNQVAEQVWSYFCSSCSITFNKGNLRQTLMSWWLAIGRKNIHFALLQYLPSIIYWEIWKNKCTIKWDNMHMSRWHIIQQVTNCLTLTLNCQFPNLLLSQVWIDKCRSVERLQQIIYSQPARWQTSGIGWVKLNVDRCKFGIWWGWRHH